MHDEHNQQESDYRYCNVILPVATRETMGLSRLAATGLHYCMILELVAPWLPSTYDKIGNTFNEMPFTHYPLVPKIWYMVPRTSYSDNCQQLDLLRKLVHV